MTSRLTITLTLAAAFVAFGIAGANAATHHTRSHGMHTTAAHSHAHGHPTAPAANADHSADALNAQSLSRAQGATQ